VDPSWVTLAWQGLAALVTLAIFSFLFGDNAIYKFTERLWVGIATGYWTMLLYHQGLYDKVVVPVFSHGQVYYLIPVLLGILMWFRISPKLGYLSRYALGFYVGIASGIYIPVTFRAWVFKQVEGSIIPIEGTWAGVNYVLALVGVICGLIYFFFSKPHTGAFGVLSKMGIYTLMIGFGAGFGLTVMGRVALLVQRVLFMRDYVVSLWGKIF
jgi:hypothetical protein